MPRAKFRKWLLLTLVFLTALPALACSLSISPGTPGANPTLPAGQSPTPIPAPDDKPPAGDSSIMPPRADVLTLGSPQALGSQEIDPTGGTIQVSQPNTPLDGLTIEVPAGAYSQTTAFELTVQPVEASDLGDEYSLLTPLINVENGDQYAEEFMVLTIPVQIPEGHFAMAVEYDPAVGLVDGWSVLAQDATSITVATRHFSSLFILSILKGELDGNIDTGFKQGVDNWHYRNWGSYIAPHGHCAGQSLTAMYYYDHLKGGGPGLYGRYDNYSSNYAETPTMWGDDVQAYRLASTAQTKTNWDGRTRKFFQLMKTKLNNDLMSYYALAFMMKMTGQPQYVSIKSEDGSGHALIAYRKYADRFYVSDPNWPQPNARRAIVYNRGTKTFESYFSGANAGETGKEYNRIYYNGKHEIVSPEELGLLWNQLMAAKVGDGLFPQVVWREVMAGAGGEVAWGDRIRENHIVNGDLIKIASITDIADYQVHIFSGPPPNPPRSGPHSGDDVLSLRIGSGRTTYGFSLFGKKDGRYTWVGFDWITFVKSYAGTWHSTGLCGEQDEFPYHWSVSIMEHRDENLVGTIHFHNCPNGGQAIYHVTGQVPSNSDTLTLQGTLSDAWGDLEDTARESVTFTVSPNGAPQPNLAP